MSKISGASWDLKNQGSRDVGVDLLNEDKCPTRKLVS